MAGTYSVFNNNELERLRSKLKLDPHYTKKMRARFCKRGLSIEEAVAIVPETVRDQLKQQLRFHFLDLRERLDSDIDGAAKLLLQTDDMHHVEAVLLRIAGGRNTVCISSQIGCAAACRFCATGGIGLVRNLSADEILTQVALAASILAKESKLLRNIVFMGMGEPFHNEKHLHQTVQFLTASDGFNLSPSAVMVSTVGIPDAMARFAETFPEAGLALSLHSANQQKRAELLPIARKYTLRELKQAVVKTAEKSRRPLMIEYLLLQGVNDAENDLAQLLEWLDNMPVHINILSYNPSGKDDQFKACSEERRTQFADSLRNAGYTVTIRYSLGADIKAACGQLAADSATKQNSTHRIVAH